MYLFEIYDVPSRWKRLDFCRLPKNAVFCCKTGLHLPSVTAQLAVLQWQYSLESGVQGPRFKSQRGHSRDSVQGKARQGKASHAIVSSVKQGHGMATQAEAEGPKGNATQGHGMATQAEAKGRKGTATQSQSHGMSRPHHGHRMPRHGKPTKARHGLNNLGKARQGEASHCIVSSLKQVTLSECPEWEQRQGTARQRKRKPKGLGARQGKATQAKATACLGMRRQHKAKPNGLNSLVLATSWAAKATHRA
ncbi:unnamed protein product [Prunus armeniaca]